MKLSTLLSPSLIVPAYAAGVVGAFLQISGGTWDVASHTLGIPDSFFTTSHLILYAGVALTLLASVGGLVLRLASQNSGLENSLFTGFSLTLIGGGLQIAAGPFDFWWHEQYGFDPFLFTPSHTLLIGGIVLSGIGMAAGSSRLLMATRLGKAPKTWFTGKYLESLTILSLATLWLVLNGLVYLLTDVQGINYTFGLGDAWLAFAEPIQFAVTPVLLAGTGAVAVLAARRTLGWRGAASTVALICTAVIATANIGFRAWWLLNSPDGNVAEGTRVAGFVPVYLLFVVPVVVFDLAQPLSVSGRWTVLATALVAPFVSLLDGFYSIVLWTRFIGLLPYLMVPMLVAGSVAALSRTRLVNALLSSGFSPAPKATLVPA